MRVDEGVDAAGVGVVLVALVSGHGDDGCVGRVAQLQDALLAVVVDERRAEQFGEVAGAGAAEGVHLPEAVLRGDVALGEEQVVECGGVDGRDALRVAGDGDRRGKPGDVDRAIELRQ
jgi:hypothetical protein